ncbi:hypothetical protein [Sulfurimonas sp.]|uniref:hypothetical protein n=1 Tax=Sulfurimonas sp. TaxID=2022749 RepID=UPI002B4A7D64|nr:hypothetical protein [Sulfurimonas sp.]
MKIVFVYLLLMSLLYASEIQRIESIVDDVSKLRVEYKNLLKIKDKEIRILKIKLAKLKKNNLKIKDENTFPKLVPKRGTNIAKSKKKEKARSFKASVFRLKKNSSIYFTPNTNKLYLWNKNRIFTSNIGTKNWIKITGYFVNKKWMRAKNELWIKRDDISKK